jgi:hypothetical protein
MVGRHIAAVKHFRKTNCCSAMHVRNWRWPVRRFGLKSRHVGIYLGRLIGHATSPRPLLETVSAAFDGLGRRSHCRLPGLPPVLLLLRSRMCARRRGAERRSNRVGLRYADPGFKRQSHRRRRLNPHHDSQRSHSVKQPSSCLKSAEHSFTLLLAQLRSRHHPSDDGTRRDQRLGGGQSLAIAGRSDGVEAFASNQDPFAPENFCQGDAHLG